MVLMQSPAGIPPSHTQKLKMGSIQTCVRNKCANVNEKPALMLYYLSLVKLGRKTVCPNTYMLVTVRWMTTESVYRHFQVLLIITITKLDKCMLSQSESLY